MFNGPEITIQQLEHISDTVIEISRKRLPDARQDNDDARIEGERNVRSRMEFITEALKPGNVKEIIHFVHAISNPFLAVRTNPGNEFSTAFHPWSNRGRGYDVAIGDVVPPSGEVIAELFTSFSTHLGKLLPLAKTMEDYSNLAAYAYAELITIHPFPDGNGRALRLFSEVIINYGRKQLNLPERNAPQIPKRGVKADTIEEVLSSWQFEMHFFIGDKNSRREFLNDRPKYDENFIANITKHWKGVEEGGMKSVDALKIVNVIKANLI